MGNQQRNLDERCVQRLVSPKVIYHTGIGSSESKHGLSKDKDIVWSIEKLIAVERRRGTNETS